MDKKVKLTSTESTLSTMATVVLVLGIICSFIVFFSNCLSWEISEFTGRTRGIDGINWMGFPTLIYCIMATLIAWSLLSVIVEISVNVRTKSNGASGGSDWEKDFALAITLGEKAKAKEILYRTILESEQFKAVLRGGNDTYHQQCIDTLNQKYEIYLKAIGENQWVHTESNDITNAFK